MNFDALAMSNLQLLDQAENLLNALNSEMYSRPCEACFKSSVGGHFRHILQHYESFAHGIGGDVIDYDQRVRGGAIETDPAEALGRIVALREQFGALENFSGNESRLVRMDEGIGCGDAESTLGREALFLLSHTVHHYALIKTILTVEGFENCPADFGVAHSTKAHRTAQTAG